MNGNRMKSIWMWLGIACAIGAASLGVFHLMSRHAAPAREGVTPPATGRPATELQGPYSVSASSGGYVRPAPKAAVLTRAASGANISCATGVSTGDLPRAGASPARDPAAEIGELLAGNDANRAAAVFDWWVRRDPESAWSYIAKLTSGNSAVDGFCWLLGEKLVNNPPAWDNTAQVVSRAAAILKGEARDSLLSSLYQVWGYRDLEPAIAHAATLPPSDGKNHAVGNLLKIWAERDLGAAVAWANQNVPDDKDYEDTIRFMAEKMIYRYPERAAQLLDAVPGLQNPSFGLLQKTIDLWVSWDDPVKAGRWIATLEDDGIRESAMISLVDRWARHNMEDCLQWALDQPCNDRAIAMALGKIATVQAMVRPGDSVDWIAGIAPGYARARCIAQYAIKTCYKWPANTAGNRLSLPPPGVLEAIGELNSELNSTELSLSAIQTVLSEAPLDPARRDQLSSSLEECYH